MGLFEISIKNINGAIYFSNTTLNIYIFLTAIIMYISHIRSMEAVYIIITPKSFLENVGELTTFFITSLIAHTLTE